MAVLCIDHLDQIVFLCSFTTKSDKYYIEKNIRRLLRYNNISCVEYIIYKPLIKKTSFFSDSNLIALAEIDKSVDFFGKPVINRFENDEFENEKRVIVSNILNRFHFVNCHNKPKLSAIEFYIAEDVPCDFLGIIIIKRIPTYNHSHFQTIQERINYVLLLLLSSVH